MLALLLQGLSLRQVEVQAAPPGSAAAQHPVLTPAHLLLPAALDAPLRCAAVAHAAAHLLYSRPAQSSAGLKPMSLAVMGALEDARVEALLMRHLPGVRPWFFAPLRAALQARGLGFAAWISRLGLALIDDHYADDSHWVHKARSGFQRACAAHGLEDAAAFRALASVLANDLGQMRVRMEPQQDAVAAAYRDDNSYLWRHAATAEDSTPIQAPMPSPPAPPPPPAEGADAPAAEDLPPTQHRYPEWHHRSAVLRTDWCTVLDHAAPSTPPGATPLRNPARERPPQPAPGRGQRLRRQWDGEEWDLDALIDLHIARRLRQAPDARVFQRVVRTPADLSLLILLDLSQSTAEPAQPGGEAVLALEQQAALLLAAAARADGVPVAIHGFSSDTRHRVSYRRLLDFDGPLSDHAATTVRSVCAHGSTRLGAALRHATALLAPRTTPQRALVVLTDGAPADIDVPDPQHLVEDAQHAVRAARAAGTTVHALVVGTDAGTSARRIFGARQVQTLPGASQLPRALARAYARLRWV